MLRSDFKLKRHAGDRLFYARVGTLIEPAEVGPEVLVAPDALDCEYHGPPDHQPAKPESIGNAAVFGARYALSHVRPEYDVTRTRIIISKIEAIESDSTWEAVAYTACYATWMALERSGTTPKGAMPGISPPVFADGCIVFPEKSD